MSFFWNLLELFVILSIFLIGMRLSSFFSGSETGFYRASALRLGIDAQAGDARAKSLLWFLQNPSNFVATTLIGNNLANYLTTFAIGLMTAYFFGEVTEALDIAATLVMAPVIFVFGELMPKFLYYQAPLKLLYRDRPFFSFVYLLCLPASMPLVFLTRLFQKLSRSQQSELGGIFSRRGLVQVLGQGHHEGVLTPIQNEMIQGIFEEISSPVTDIMIPRDRIYDVSHDAERDEVLELAKQFGVEYIFIRHPEIEKHWIGYYSVARVAVGRTSLENFKKELPELDASCSIVNAIRQLRLQSRECAVVFRQGEVIGVVTDGGISEHMFASSKKKNAITRMMASD